MRYNDNSPHPERWTNAKLMARAMETANLKTFSGGLPQDFRPDNNGGGFGDDGDAIREATRLYRGSWMNPVLAEIERRFVKGGKAATPADAARLDAQPAPKGE